VTILSMPNRGGRLLRRRLPHQIVSQGMGHEIRSAGHEG
jgi:hypothetical protein